MKEIFCNTHVIQNFDTEKGILNLKEKTTKVDQSILISGIPDDAILLKLDVGRPNYKVRSAYLRVGHKFIHKGCDYCLILPQRNLAILFELKSKRPKGYVDQFNASQIFIEYCLKLWNTLHCNTQELNFKRILFTKNPSYRLTDSRRLIKIEKWDRCNERIEIFSPGFPHRIRLEKLL